MRTNIKGIARDALQFVLEVSASSHPKEFAGLLCETDGVITDVDVPITQSSNVSAVMNLFMLPVSTHIVGSAHSHPSGALQPSDADLRLFMQKGAYHIIVGYPYDTTSWVCYDKFGEKRQLDVLDVEISESAVYRDIQETFGDEND
ncbi:MAG TPA: Mov34/MPN/PAD-1 family protein [Candidatus Bathyarchaeia archaeon]|nr:Mov34/MPN/PAD-1 family protein [Candidatus Bathyarchaeia archaeon]